MKKSSRRYYFIMLGILAVLSAYPLVMGGRIVLIQWMNGGIKPEDYARYVIPYTALCASVLITAALYPALSRLKKSAVLAATALALGLFVGIELYMESITIYTPAAQSAARLQLLMCAYTPAAMQATQFFYNETYKIHYFLVSFVIILLVTGIVYGYGRMIQDESGKSKMPLHLELVSAVLLIALCIFANFTGFFRERTDTLSPLSSFLTGTFFVVLGASLGIYAGSRLLCRGKALSIGLPAALAMLVCSVMYFGEYNLLGGTLYRFGTSFFFEGLPAISVAPVDILVIVLGGAATALVMGIAKAKYIRMQQEGIKMYNVNN